MSDIREPQTEVGQLRGATHDLRRKLLDVLTAGDIPRLSLFEGAVRAEVREELAAVRADRAHWRQAFVEIVEDQNPSLRDYIVGLLDAAMGATPTPMTAEETAETFHDRHCEVTVAHDSGACAAGVHWTLHHAWPMPLHLRAAIRSAAPVEHPGGYHPSFEPES